jgi:ribosomal protein L12E/L44/L45/RPP1/RPP2
LPAPKTFQGTLEVVELADVTSMDEVRSKVVARKLEQHELDEILRRRRANG